MRIYIILLRSYNKLNHESIHIIAELKLKFFNSLYSLFTLFRSLNKIHESDFVFYHHARLLYHFLFFHFLSNLLYITKIVVDKKEKKKNYCIKSKMEKRENMEKDVQLHTQKGNTSFALDFLVYVLR